jgi:hypothetical protein
MICPLGLVFGGNEVVRFCFHVLRSRTHFRRCRVRRVSFSYFARFGLIFGGTEGVGYSFYVLRARTHFRRYRGRRVPFSCFARPDTFLAVPSVSGPVFMFCAPVHVFESTAGIGSHFHVLLAQTRLWRYRGRRLPFSCFVLPDLGSMISGASGPVFMFCVLELSFGGTEVVRFSFHVLRLRTRFRRCRAHQVSFSCFARPNSFSTVPRASSPIFMFCAH